MYRESSELYEKQQCKYQRVLRTYLPAPGHFCEELMIDHSEIGIFVTIVPVGVSTHISEMAWIKRLCCASNRACE